jgi:type 1 glutamine amidotransferase
MRYRSFLCLLGFLMASILPACAGNPERKIRVLIVDGFSNHDWRQTTLLLRGILESAGEFDVSVSTAPQDTAAAAWAAWRPHFAGYDVVIQTCNDYGNNGLLEGVTPAPQWPEAVKKDFVEFVRKGGGVYIFHAAENAFLGWKEYEEMVGLSWREADYGTAIRVSEEGRLMRIPPGVGGSTGHGPRSNVLVKRLGDDPIHAGLPRAWLSPDMEVYFYARGPAERVQVLAYARDSQPGQGMLWPVEWTTTYGKGRVYVSTYGHVWKGDVQPESMRCAAVETIIPRALEWLAGRPVTFPVAKDFPGVDAVSVREKIPSAF